MSKKKEKPKLSLSIKKLSDLNSQYKQGTLKDYVKAVQEANNILSKPTLAQAFSTPEGYKEFIDRYKSSIDSAESALKSLSGFEDYLKKDYGFLAKAAEQYASLAKIPGIDSISDKGKKYLEGLTGKESALEYASALSKTASSLSRDLFLEQTKKQKETLDKLKKPMAFETKSPTLDLDKYPKNIDIHESIRKKAEEKEQRDIESLVNSKKQTENLELIVEYTIRQSEVLDLQNGILKMQVENLNLQNQKLEEQISKIEHQNKIMQEQQDDNRKTSKVAFWTAVASIVIGSIIGAFGVYFSYRIYHWEDSSDNKNHKELLQTIKSSSSNQNLIELMKQQLKTTETTNKLLQKSLSAPKKQKPQKLDNGQKPSS